MPLAMPEKCNIHMAQVGEVTQIPFDIWEKYLENSLGETRKGKEQKQNKMTTKTTKPQDLPELHSSLTVKLCQTTEVLMLPSSS